MRRLPPLNALKAFEATARLGGVQKASEELHVTHGAVSRHVKQLEQWLGTTLFERSQRSVQLNQVGRDYLHTISAALDLIHQGTTSIKESSSNVLGINTTHSFATKWLMDKLPEFSKAYPHYEVWLSINQNLSDFVTDRVDLGIRMGKGPWPELRSIGLMKDSLIVVCSEDYLTQHQLSTPADLARATLLHDQDPAIQWQQWLEQFVPILQQHNLGPRFSSADVVLRAARNSQGVALVSEILAQEDLRQNKLVKPFNQKIDLGFYYWLVMAKHKQANQKQQDFIDWIQETTSKKGNH